MMLYIGEHTCWECLAAPGTRQVPSVRLWRRQSDNAAAETVRNVGARWQRADFSDDVGQRHWKGLELMNDWIYCLEMCSCDMLSGGRFS